MVLGERIELKFDIDVSVCVRGWEKEQVLDMCPIIVLNGTKFDNRGN